MNHIVFLVEDLSTSTFLEIFLEENYSQNFTFQIINFQGKSDMINRLPSYLKGFRSWSPENYKYVILIDRDSEDCIALKNQLEDIISSCRFTSRRSTTLGHNCFTWIATEEIESWYFGSFPALNKAFPRLPDKSHTSKYRNPDNILGGTWEALERELKSVGYYRSGIQKIDLAKKVAPYISKMGNTSVSFNGFILRLEEFI